MSRLIFVLIMLSFCSSSAVATVGIDIPKKGVSIFAQEEEDKEVKVVYVKEEKNVFLAGVLSFLLAGAGNFYAGDMMGGSIHLGIFVVLFSDLNRGNSRALSPSISRIGLFVNSVASIYTAVQAAKKHNESIPKVSIHPVLTKRGGLLLAQVRF